MADLAFWLGLVTTTAAAWAGGGARAALSVALIWILAGALLTAVLPRAAHVAFERGQLGAARFRYRLLARLSPTRARRASARVSVAACLLATGELDRAARELGRVDEGALGGAGRAAWLNNRAYAALKSGTDPHAALAWTDEAARLRPDVPGLVHTRGLALLAAGRTDDAIRAFEEMWELGELSPRLEAERCRDLARAWEQKGHLDYAADYRARAARLDGAPGDLLPPPPMILDESVD